VWAWTFPELRNAETPTAAPSDHAQRRRALEPPDEDDTEMAER